MIKSISADFVTYLLKPIWCLVGHIVNKWHASLAVDSVKLSVCLKDWLKSVD